MLDLIYLKMLTDPVLTLAQAKAAVLIDIEAIKDAPIIVDNSAEAAEGVEVDAYLNNLKANDFAEFEKQRFKPFAAQLAAARA